MNPSSDVFGWAILTATFLGPIFAVFATRFVDQKREAKERKFRIFRTLMSTRINNLSPDAIQALNLVEIDFSDNKKVISAWKNYLQHLSMTTPTKADEQAILGQKNRHLRTMLLHEIAKDLKYKFDQIELLEGGYYPTGIAKLESDQQAIRELFAAIAQGNKALPITVKNSDTMK